jgi:hypothetical protein
VTAAVDGLLRAVARVADEPRRVAAVPLPVAVGLAEADHLAVEDELPASGVTELCGEVESAFVGVGVRRLEARRLAHRVVCAAVLREMGYGQQEIAKCLDVTRQTIGRDGERLSEALDAREEVPA